MSSQSSNEQFKGNLDDVMNGLFGKARSKINSEEKGVPWEAKIIDGKYHVPLSQVTDLLRENGVLPKVRVGIEQRVEKGPPKTAQKFGNETTKDL